MKNSKAFTLVELMAVIVIISLIALLTFPNIINQIKKTKKSNNKMVEEIVLTQAKKYVNDNLNEFEDNEYCIGIETLLSNDYIKDGIVKNSDIMDKKVIFLSNDKYVLMDKDKCKVNNCKSDYCDDDENWYTEVEYLESYGFQYIDTGLPTRENMKIDVKYYINNYNTERNYVFGVYGMDGANYGYRMQWSHTNNSFAGYGNLSTGNIITDNSKNINHLLFTEGKFYLNDTMVYDASNASLVYSDNNDKNIYLFALNGNGGISYFSSIRMYYMKIYEGDALLRDYVPVIDKNKRPCLFDKVERKCYYNQGTGEFNQYNYDDILVDKSNERYVKVNYIESSGTQYIDTGLSTRENMKIDIQYYINNYEATRNYVFGVYGADGGYRMQWSHSNTSFAGYGNLYNSNILSDNSKNLNHLVVDKGKFYLNDIMIYDASNASLVYSENNNKNIYLFALNGNGGISNISSIRVYYMKIYEGDTLLRDYVPVITLSGKACLFDKVNKECYYNKGTGEFLYG